MQHDAPSREHPTTQTPSVFQHEDFYQANQSRTTSCNVAQGHSRPSYTHIHACTTTIPSYFSGLACVFLRYSNNTIKLAVLYQSIQGHNSFIVHTFREGSEPHCTISSHSSRAAQQPGLLQVGYFTHTHSVTVQTIHSAVTRCNNLWLISHWSTMVIHILCFFITQIMPIEPYSIATYLKHLYLYQYENTYQHVQLLDASGTLSFRTLPLIDAFPQYFVTRLLYLKIATSTSYSI